MFSTISLLVVACLVIASDSQQNWLVRKKRQDDIHIYICDDGSASTSPCSSGSGGGYSNAMMSMMYPWMMMSMMYPYMMMMNPMMMGYGMGYGGLGTAATAATTAAVSPAITSAITPAVSAMQQCIGPCVNGACPAGYACNSYGVCCM